MINKYTLFISTQIFCCIVLPADDEEIFRKRCTTFLGMPVPAKTTPAANPITDKIRKTLQSQLEIACTKDDTVTARALIQAGADPNMPNARGNNPAHIAAFSNALQTIKMLATETTVDLNAYNNAKETPLSIAIRQNIPESISTVEHLLSLNADPNKPATSVLWTPLMIASRLNNTPIMGLLLQFGANPHETVNHQNPLSLAYRFLCPDAANLLLEQPGATTPFHPLRYIFGPKGTFEHDDTRDIMPMLAVLKKHLIDLNASFVLNNKNQSALNHALENRRSIRAVKALLTSGAQVSTETVLRLFDACMEHQNISDIDNLTACLALTKTVYKKGKNSLLIEAAKMHKLCVAKAIIEACPHYCLDTHNCLDKYGMHPIHHLVNVTQDDPLVHACIDLLAPFVNAKDADGETPLMTTEHPAVAAHLIARGADIYATDNRSITPLSMHIMLSNPEMVKFLLSQDASIHTPEARRSLSRLAQITLEHREQSGTHELMTLDDFFYTTSLKDKAEQIASVIRRPVSEAERETGTKMVKQYLNISPKHLFQREVTPRSYKHLKRS